MLLFHFYVLKEILNKSNQRLDVQYVVTIVM